MVLELDEKETEMLKHVLESFDNELRTLIARTDGRDARAELHSDEAVARRLLETVSRGARPVGDIEGYCDNLSVELAGWKAKLAGVIKKLDSVSTGDKEKVVAEVNELHMVMDELDDRIGKLRRECETSWAPEREEIEQKAGWLRQRVIEIAETIPQSDIGG
jgi:chromosome segregation ATPase